METVTLKLPPRLLRDAARVAHGDDVTVGHLVRVLLAREVERRLNPKTSNRADEGLLAALQALLAEDMAEAENWNDLAQRLARHGYELRPAGGGLALFKRSCGTRVCKGSELGFGYRMLVARFGCAMPGHPHGAAGLDIARMRPDTPPLEPSARQRLQDRFGPVFEAATDWEGLIRALHEMGTELRPMGTGAALYALPQGRHICNAKTVGHRYRALVKRFGAPMPGHPHGADWIRGPAMEEDLEVIERDL